MPEENTAAKGAVSAPDARMLASTLLHNIVNKRQPLDEAWENCRELRLLEHRDQRMCRLLLLITLRQLGYIDSILDTFLENRSSLPPMVVIALRLGVAQLLFLRTPPHAAVSTSLDLLSKEKKGLKGVVNAVLRKVAALPPPVDHAASWEQSMPAWLLARWREAYGAETAASIAKACIGEPPLDITVKSDPAGWAEKLQARLLPNGTLRLPHSVDVVELPGFNEGAWWVQDAASSLPVRLMGDMNGKLIYDLCAAPGGKTMQMASAGANVIALDRSEKRLQRLLENAKRLQIEIVAKTGDAATYTDAPADIVLLDAPCSATGTIRRHPDIMHTKTQDDVTRLAATQRRILDHAKGLVKPGGLLIYAVCSLQPEEGPEQIAAFLAENKGWARVPATAAELGSEDLAELLTKDGDLRTLPCHMSPLGGMDGFYAARLKRLT